MHLKWNPAVQMIRGAKESPQYMHPTQATDWRIVPNVTCCLRECSRKIEATNTEYLYLVTAGVRVYLSTACIQIQGSPCQSGPAICGLCQHGKNSHQQSQRKVDLLLILELRVVRCCPDNSLLVLPPTPPPDEDQITETEAPADDDGDLRRYVSRFVFGSEGLRS